MMKDATAGLGERHNLGRIEVRYITSREKPKTGQTTFIKAKRQVTSGIWAGGFIESKLGEVDD